MGELGLLDRFLALPHERVHRLRAQIGDVTVPIADFDHLPTRCRFIAFMPQWEFLNFLAEEGRRYPTFRLWMRAEVSGLIEASARVVGVDVRTPEGPRTIRASLVVAADGRSSVLRAQAGLPVDELGAPIDVLWFRLSRRSDDEAQTMGRFDTGRIFIIINRGEHWQCGYVIAKGSLDALRQGGLEAFRREVARLAPFAADRLAELASWDDVKLLTVRVDRARRWWRPGLLCIGDAAHAMSPVGGVGINLAIQDAVAAANRLLAPLREDRVTPEDLHAVQRRREWPTRVTQRIQVLVQDRVITPVLSGRRSLQPPRAVRLLARCPLLRRIPGRLVGIGIRPEHVAPALRAPASETSPSSPRI
jgi:2-polyprenyl-6-methoxyphenol hydroxylase-like FAD-dependent oxidoreductase